MENLYHQTNKMVHEIQQNMGRLETARDEDIHVIENELQARIDQIVGNCDRLDILVNKEHPTRRQNARLKVDQVKYDCQHLQSALRNFQHRRYVRNQQQRERELLMETKFTTNDADTSIQMDASLNHHHKLQGAHKGMDDLISHGSSVIENLRNQRGSLKGIKTKMLNIANTLGMSNTVMRLIEKRTTQDKFVLFGGMILTTIFMFLIWKYFA
ncbi:Golgi SNAP receptor complex member 2-like [Styela clava]|uniref:Golgi SNAP receptor complex member 2-like n=1 Tax=Styela clava TaxID=7725 RepID=UPI00193AB4CB|nr:Golgi SNAP receptor complex member 2-like [Styela clava]